MTAGTIPYTDGDQMASVTRAGYSYNYTYAGVGNGELLSNQTPAANYAYTYGRTNAQGKPIIEQVRRGTDTAFMENDATGTPIMIRTSAGMQALYVYDNSGSPVALITSANTTAFAYSFDPYGTATTTTTTGGNGEPQTPFLYTGGLNDRTTGFTLDGARYYNPGEGRWTQNDTLDIPLDPNNANRYAYAADNPINFTDPTGLDSAWGQFTTILGVVGLAAFVVAQFTPVGWALDALDAISYGIGVSLGAASVACTYQMQGGC